MSGGRGRRTAREAKYTSVAVTSQTDLVRDTLLRTGRVSTFDAIFEGIGGRHPTRVAAIIHTLRHREGFVIDTEQDEGGLAVYVLRGVPGGVVSPVLSQTSMWDTAGDGLGDDTPAVSPLRQTWGHRSCGYRTKDVPGKPTIDPTLNYGRCPNCGDVAAVFRKEA